MMQIGVKRSLQGSPSLATLRRAQDRNSARNDPFPETAESLSSFVVPALRGVEVDYGVWFVKT
jgi:hypothetical protein